MPTLTWYLEIILKPPLNFERGFLFVIAGGVKRVTLLLRGWLEFLQVGPRASC